MEIDVDNITDSPQSINTPSSSSSQEHSDPCDSRLNSEPQTSTNNSAIGNNSNSSNGADNVIRSGDNEGEPTQFNEFQYWRPPLPVIDVALDDSDKPTETEQTPSTTDKEAEASNSQEEPKDIEKTAREQKLESDLEESVKLLEQQLQLGENKEDQSNSTVVPSSEASNEDKKSDEASDEGTSVDPPAASQEDQDEKKLHSAAVLTAEEEVVPEEQVTNIGSMHVLGHQVDQKTMAIVDGVVQGNSRNHTCFI